MSARLSAAQARLFGRFAVAFTRSEKRDWVALFPSEGRTALALEARGLVTVRSVPMLGLMSQRAVLTAAGHALLAEILAEQGHE